MKKTIIPAFGAMVLTGCAAMALTQPPTEFVGSLPEEWKQEFTKFNDLPPEGDRGEVRQYHFDSERSLLTIIRQLRSTRWNWQLDASKVKPALVDVACDNFGDAIAMGLGVRFWYTGAGGFVSEPVTNEACIAKKS
ncbi:hypothetical protein Q4491_03385 [Photobacterium sp. 2_MG-2023]|uniref:hypothetical protein n=1 Tax=unclassified Photobacterium TaxID=2628852 RepID=UPI001C488E13|nr:MULTISPECIES: hypothetical protein [unclassified Photobacterium]MBV7261128.1 hypothetical protein [Photobacterium sp. WH24]MDO6580378.1 hypothetical protein [Photobacterium sp. 2_MG-2023]